MIVARNNPAFPHETFIMPPPPPDAPQLNKESKRPLQNPKKFDGLYGLHNPRLLHPRWVPYIRGVFKNSCLVKQDRSSNMEQRTREIIFGIAKLKI